MLSKATKDLISDMNAAGVTKVADLVKKQKPEVCDDCLNVAYDLGCTTYEEQAYTMVELGQELEDHVCEAVDEPEIKCECACRFNR